MAVQRILITIPASHFCEKARWGLDHAQLPYEERTLTPGAHRVAVRRHGTSTVPVLLDGDSVLRESTDILRYSDELAVLDLFPAEEPEVERTVAAIDHDLGPAVRRWFYSHAFLDRSLLEAMLNVATHDGRHKPPRVPLSVLMRAGRTAFQIDTNTRARTVDEIHRALERIAGNRDGDYLHGDRFTAADLTFAALTAPLVMPPPHEQRLPAHNWTDALGDDIAAFRETTAATTLTLYEHHRSAAR